MAIRRTSPEAVAYRILNGQDVPLDARRRSRCDAREAQQHGGELLTDLVVQLLGDPQTLGLLGAQDASGRLTTLVLERDRASR